MDVKELVGQVRRGVVVFTTTPSQDLKTYTHERCNRLSIKGLMNEYDSHFTIGFEVVDNHAWCKLSQDWVTCNGEYLVIVASLNPEAVGLPPRLCASETIARRVAEEMLSELAVGECLACIISPKGKEYGLFGLFNLTPSEFWNG